MADTLIRDLAGILHQKAVELSARAHALADHHAAANAAEVEFILAMIGESESAVAFWTDEIKKAARK